MKILIQTSFILFMLMVKRKLKRDPLITDSQV